MMYIVMFMFIVQMVQAGKTSGLCNIRRRCILSYIECHLFKKYKYVMTLTNSDGAWDKNFLFCHNVRLYKVVIVV